MLLDNLVVWAILACALPCYILLLEMVLTRDLTQVWFERSRGWFASLQAGIAALPLLGLLGTIVGLLDTFVMLAAGAGTHQAVMSGGIADALFTTQMGLLMAIPGWLMLAWLNGKMKAWELQQCEQA